MAAVCWLVQVSGRSGASRGPSPQWNCGRHWGLRLYPVSNRHVLLFLWWERKRKNKVINGCNVVWVGAWRADKRDLLRAGQTSSTFILRCPNNETVPWHFIKRPNYEDIPCFLHLHNQQRYSWKKKKKHACLVSRGARRIPLQWCNSFIAVTLSLSLPCISNRLNTHLCSSSRLLSTPTLGTQPAFRCHGKGAELLKQVMQQWVLYTCLHNFKNTLPFALPFFALLLWTFYPDLVEGNSEAFLHIIVIISIHTSSKSKMLKWIQGNLVKLRI